MAKLLSGALEEQRTACHSFFSFFTRFLSFQPVFFSARVAVRRHFLEIRPLNALGNVCARRELARMYIFMRMKGSVGLEIFTNRHRTIIITINTVVFLKENQIAGLWYWQNQLSVLTLVVFGLCFCARPPLVASW